ncbi:hypothetical protein UFOVP105_22 [uncultured Caudovirales phage]|uniref:Uncharacterized protein n=1 Tax=uncultured Caudovirales phage TaxID=2100421 RepID=A0A6J5L4H0_9CAUD|nr:hypothetical protein UFOVP105_22 [uncultured Caudovirales phage]
MERVNEFFASHVGAKAVCQTTDGSFFHIDDLSFANAHSFRMEDQKIKIYALNEDVKEENKRLFFEGSKYEFVLVTPEATEEKSRFDELSVSELRDLAENLEGYTTKLNKSKLIELLIKNEL